MFHSITVFTVFGQLNATLMSIRDFFKKKKIKKILQIQNLYYWKQVFFM